MGRCIVRSQESFRLRSKGAIMGDKSPRQTASKKSSKSIKEKRADKRASESSATEAAKPSTGNKK